MKRIIVALMAAFTCQLSIAQNQVVFDAAANNTTITACAPSATDPNVQTTYGIVASGGSSNPTYSNGENVTVTFCPFTAGDAVTATFTIFNLSTVDTQPGNGNNSDQMFVFDGPNTAAPSLGNYGGTSIQGTNISATITNTSGCLTFQFVSNDQGTGTFSGSVACSTPCDPPLAAGILLNGENGATDFIKVCIGEEVQFQETDSDAAIGYDLIGYNWDFMDGTSVAGTDNGIVSHTWTQEGQYFVQLFVQDDNTDNVCTNTNFISLEVLVAPQPQFVNFQEDAEICVGEQVSFTAEPDIYEVTWSGFNGATEIEEGCFTDDQLGVAQDVEIYQTGFVAGTVIENVSDILDVCFEMEHSFIGDIVVILTCPNGQNMTFYQQGGGGINLGEPNPATNMADFPCNDPAVIGIPYEYCFSPSATQTWVEYSQSPGAGQTLPAGTYEPVQPFSNLVGCPANGIWTLTIVDNWAVDDGQVFSFTLNLNPDFYPPVTVFTPDIGIDASQSFWNTGTLPSYASISDSNADQIVITPTQASPPGGDVFTYTVVDDFGCSNSTSFTVTTFEALQVTAGPDLQYACGSLTLEGGFVGVPSCQECIDNYNIPYVANEYWIETYCPDANDGTMMAITVSGSVETCCDLLQVYNGPSDTDPVLFAWGEGTGLPAMLNPPQQFVSTDPSGCITISILPDVSVQPVITITVSAFDPSGVEIGGGPDYTFEWTPATFLDDPSALQPVASGITQATTYTLVGYPTGHQACSSTDEMQITISPLGDPGISVTLPTFCDTLMAPIDIFNLLGGNPTNQNDLWILPDGSTYTPDDNVTPAVPPLTVDVATDINPADPTPTFIADPTDAFYPNYTFTHEVSLGTCATQATVTISFTEELNATVTADHEICDDATTDLEVLTTTNGMAPYNYQWSHNSTNISGLEDLMSFEPTESGLYCVRVSDGCSHQINRCVDVTVRPKAPVTMEAMTYAQCWPDPFNLSITTDPALYQDSYWEISSGQTFMNMPNLNLLMENPGSYDVSLTLEDDLGCIYDTIIYNYIESYDPPTAGYLASEDEVSSFDPIVSFTNMSEGDIVSYNWTFDNANDQFYSEETEPSFTFPFGVGGIYEVELQVIDVNGCIDVATGNIEVQEPFLFFIPTGFTPNGDNINDGLQIVSNDLDEAVFEMTIFNRWGQTVFHTNDPHMPWMGQQMDSEYYVPNGVYMWNATVRSKATGEKKEINGTITITR